MSKQAILLLTIALATATIEVSASESQHAYPVGQPIHTGISYELASRALGDIRQVNVWVPPDYAQNQDRYNVVYLLDGALDQDFFHISGLAQLGSLSWTYGPIIVVGVQTKERHRELTPPATDGRYRIAFPTAGDAERFRAFLGDEVIPFIETTYRAGPRRALIGESLAGLFVVDTLLSQPELFHDYVAISPSLWWDDRRPMHRAANRLKRTPSDRRLYLAIANEGGTMQEGVDLLRGALAGLPPGAVSVMYSDRSSTTTHSTIYHSAAEQALRWLYPMPAHDMGPTPWYMIDGMHPSAKDSER